MRRQIFRARDLYTIVIKYETLSQSFIFGSK
jgi:hypothetical protein